MIEPKKTSRPAKFGTRGAWQAEADHMRAHQGDTFIIERRPHPNRAAYALAAHVRSGGYVAFRPAGSFDAWVEREGANLEVVATFTGGTHAPEAAGTVAAIPAPEPAEAVAVTAGPAHPIGSQLYRHGYPPVQVVKVTAKCVFVNNGGRDFRLDRARLEETGFALVHDFKYSGDYTELYADEAARDADSPAAGDPQPARPKRTVEVRSEDAASEAVQETVTPPVEFQAAELEEIDADVPGIIAAVKNAIRVWVAGKKTERRNITLSELHALVGRDLGITEDRLREALRVIDVVAVNRKAGPTYTARVDDNGRILMNAVDEPFRRSFGRLLDIEFFRARVHVCYHDGSRREYYAWHAGNPWGCAPGQPGEISQEGLQGIARKEHERAAGTDPCVVRCINNEEGACADECQCVTEGHYWEDGCIYPNGYRQPVVSVSHESVDSIAVVTSVDGGAVLLPGNMNPLAA